MAGKPMRKTRPEHFLGPNGAGSVCACGCGLPIQPTRPWHKFASAECRKRAWRAERMAPAKIAEIEFRLAGFDKRLRYVEDLLAGEGSPRITHD